MNGPDRIWALSDRRRTWQDGPPEEGQKPWHWQEYVREDIHQAALGRIKQAIRVCTVVDVMCEGRNPVDPAKVARQVREALSDPMKDIQAMGQAFDADTGEG